MDRRDARRLGALVACCALVLSACGGDDGTPTETTEPPPEEPGEIDPGEEAPPEPAVTDADGDGVALELFAAVEGALELVPDPATGDLLIADVGGTVVRVPPGGGEGEVLLDLSDRIGDGFEQGLLGLAVSNDGSRLYLNFTAVDDTSHVVEYEMSGGQADPATEREVLTLDQPDFTHNGGHLIIDDDDLLWIGFGDGAASNELIPGTGENAQDLTNLHGTILRIDPRPDGDAPYGIPGDNPFVGTDDARDEIWSYGLRNPWRFSFDPATGDLWIADVGEHDREELNRSLAVDGAGRGVNYGWNIWEGTRRHTDGDLDEHEPPLLELDHDDGYCAVIGGVTYRGEAIAELDGWTLFSDLCDPTIRAVRATEDGQVEVRDLGLTVAGVVAFAADADGEVYALSMLEGAYKLVPA